MSKEATCSGLNHIWDRYDLVGLPCRCGMVRWGEQVSGSGICARCGSPYDDHHWSMEQGSYETACPVGRK